MRGQVPPLAEMLDGFQQGLLIVIGAIFLLLAANFQSLKLSIIVMSTAPAALAGVALSLWLTHSTINLDSFMGAIMALGVAVANAILLVTFAERARISGATAAEAAKEGARSRLRPILMTSLAMIAGMLPVAIGIGDADKQMVPTWPRCHWRPWSVDPGDFVCAACNLRPRAKEQPSPQRVA